MKCPICNTEMEYWEDYIDSIALETSHECKKGCGSYQSHYMAGNYEVAVKENRKWRIWQWSYTTSQEEEAIINREIKKAVQRVKEQQENKSEEDSNDVEMVATIT